MTNMEIRKPSSELISMMQAAATSAIGFAELWDSIKQKGASEGFDEKELLKLFSPMVKDKFTESQIRYMTHREQEQERAKQNRLKQKEQVKALRRYADIPPKKEPEQKTPPPVVTPPKEPERDWNAEYNAEMAKIESIRAMPRPSTPQPKFTKDDPDMNTVVFRMGIEGKLEAAPKAIKDELADYADWIVKDLPMLQRRGWRAVEVTIRVVS